MASADTATIKEAVINIKVFGIGGGGNSVLKRIAETEFEGIELVAVNTDAKQLETLESAEIRTVQIGEALTRGRGTGGNPNIGEQAAKREEAMLREMIRGSDLIFITAGMGGGTGTGVAPIMARLAREMGILTVGIVTMPFGFEGQRKRRIANEGVVKMQAYMDALISVQNDNLMKLPDNHQLSLVDAFRAADEVLRQAISCIAELILTTGVVNVDFADVATVFRQSDSSDAILGIGRSKVSAMKAIQQAVESPLIEKSLNGARGMLLNITGDESLTLHDVCEATDYIYKQTGDDVNIIFGTVVDKSMNGIVQATIIATDFADSIAVKSQPLPVPENKVEVSGQFNLDTPEFMSRKIENKPETAFAIPAFRLSRDEEK